MPYFRANVADKRTGRTFGLRVCGADQAEALKRLYGLGFVVAAIRPSSGPKPDPSLRAELKSICEYAEPAELVDQAVGEVFEAWLEGLNSGPNALERMLLATGLEWHRDFDRHALLDNLTKMLFNLDDPRAEVCAWQWMAEVRDFRNGLRRDESKAISDQNCLEVSTPCFLSDYLNNRGEAERAEEVWEIFNKTLNNR